MAALMEDDGLETDDYYTLLNVSRKASKEEITSAFRRLSRIYHPDKHQDPLKKKKAETLFAKLKDAYEVLTDEGRRELYDKFGTKGLEILGQEVITRTKSPAEIIAELDRYHKEQEERKLQQRTNPKGTVSVSINLSDYFDESYVDDDYGSQGSGVEISGMALTQSVECPLTPKNTVVITGSVHEQNGTGQGQVALLWRRLTSDTGWMAGEVSLGNNAGGVSLQGFKQLYRRCYYTGSVGLISTQRGFKPYFRNILVYQLDRHLQGRLTYNVLVSVKTDLIYETEQHRAAIGVQVGVMSSFCQLSYERKFQDHGFKFRVVGKLSTTGAILQYGCEKKISQFSWLSGTMSVGTSGVSLDVRVSRGQQTFMFPIKLSDVIEPSAVFYGTLIPSVVYFAVKKLIVDPYIRQQEKEKQDNVKEEQLEKLRQKKQEAAATIELMKETVERNIEYEERRNGLIIVKAVYGQLITQDGVLVESQCIDVRVPLQALVKDSQLILMDSKTKSGIPGFYDPCPDEEKSLYIRYTFRNRPHQVTITDSEPIRIPLQIIKALYQDTESCVRLGGQHTNWFVCSSGVRQGDNLSPTLFALFINDLATEVKNLNKGIDIGSDKLSILLYADDIALIAENESDMELMLGVVDNWCKQWRLRINATKSKVVHFRKKQRRRSDHEFSLGGDKLEYASTYKYLGVLFEEFVTFKANAENLAKSGGRALGSIISKIHSNKSIGFKTYEKLYYSGVAPILDYCSGIWGFSRSLNIESVQHRALRYFLGVHRFTPILSLQGESGWVPAYCRHQLNAIRFWNRLITMSDDRLTKKVFVWDKEQSNRSNWSNNMKRLFDSLDLADVYDNCAISDLAQVESRIYRNFVNTWHEDLQNISKLRTYRVIKHDFQTEPYIIMDLPKPERSNPGGPGGPGQPAQPSKRLQQTQAQVDEVVDIMRVNVDKVLERDQKISELDDRADALQAGASQFEATSGKLKRKYWWKNCKMWIILISIILVIIIIIVGKSEEIRNEVLPWKQQTVLVAMISIASLTVSNSSSVVHIFTEPQI
ncbi:hypothetical protein FSP39_009031 [Pinctada imbricata]|uniref:J domain-containing protein n=1 Tax=Pinctada imbricata TaxID=66713 RepID=A0AA88YG12_PINIB|nr:hypothetical protein FSP39_009031 [Pinctada imbricata]